MSFAELVTTNRDIAHLLVIRYECTEIIQLSRGLSEYYRYIRDTYLDGYYVVRRGCPRGTYIAALTRHDDCSISPLTIRGITVPLTDIEFLGSIAYGTTEMVSYCIAHGREICAPDTYSDIPELVPDLHTDDYESRSPSWFYYGIDLRVVDLFAITASRLYDDAIRCGIRQLVEYYFMRYPNSVDSIGATVLYAILYTLDSRVYMWPWLTRDIVRRIASMYIDTINQDHAAILHMLRIIRHVGCQSNCAEYSPSSVLAYLGLNYITVIRPPQYPDIVRRLMSIADIRQYALDRASRPAYRGLIRLLCDIIKDEDDIVPRHAGQIALELLRIQISYGSADRRYLLQGPHGVRANLVYLVSRWTNLRVLYEYVVRRGYVSIQEMMGAIAANIKRIEDGQASEDSFDDSPEHRSVDRADMRARRHTYLAHYQRLIGAEYVRHLSAMVDAPHAKIESTVPPYYGI